MPNAPLTMREAALECLIEISRGRGPDQRYIAIMCELAADHPKARLGLLRITRSALTVPPDEIRASELARTGPISLTVIAIPGCTVRRL